MDTWVAKTEEDLEGIARTLFQNAKERDGAVVLALSGDLGAGKTAFTKAFARVLGISEHVTSPTFVIMKSYSIPGGGRFKTLTHMDAYRIESEDEIRVLGFESLLNDIDRLIVIEWPERLSGLVPEDAIRLHITIGGEGERIVTHG